MKIVQYSKEYRSQVIDLILRIQREEFSISITADEQPDLSNIEGFYQSGSGNFWVALVEDRVIGTISLLDIGNRQAALRKMFVNKSFRGTVHAVALKLLNTAISYANSCKVREIYLGTTEKFLAAHRFYEKCGFVEIDKPLLPKRFPFMVVDTKFYTYTLLTK